MFHLMVKAIEMVVNDYLLALALSQRDSHSSNDFVESDEGDEKLNLYSNFNYIFKPKK